MARIRTLKPDHGQHRKVGPLSDRAFRVWVSGLVTQADDEGRLIVDPEEIRVKVFGYHPTVSTPEVVEMIGEIIQRRLLHVFEHEGQTIGQLHDWQDHQAVRKSSHFKTSSLPSFSPSVSVPPLFRQYSVTIPLVFRPPRKGKEGKEGKGKDISSDPKAPGSSVPPLDPHLQSWLQDSMHLQPLSNGKHGKLWKALERAYDQYSWLYFQDEINKMDAWMEANPNKKPTERGMPRFVRSWFERAVERGRKTHA